MKHRPKNKNWKVMSNLVLVLAAMGICFYFMQAEINPLMSKWIFFCLAILFIYFLVIWLKNKFKK